MRLIDADIAEERIGNLLQLLEETCKDIRETHGDDSVCGLCEYDADFSIGENGDYMNECPGFDSDDCFCMKKSIVEKYTTPIPTAYNVEKVVEQLEERKNRPPELEYRYLNFEEAIKIIKAGGVDD